jgi:probable rRNA maturation factor
LKINVFYDDIKYRLTNKKRIKEIIEKVIREEKKLLDDLNFVFTDDKSILNINKEFLKNNYYTDVIAFSYGENKRINGEIYISIETVRKNAYNYKVSFSNEILRVMIHGTLHLCGYDDKTDREREIMRKKEDFWIEKYKEK